MSKEIQHTPRIGTALRVLSSRKDVRIDPNRLVIYVMVDPIKRVNDLGLKCWGHIDYLRRCGMRLVHTTIFPNTQYVKK